MGGGGEGAGELSRQWVSMKQGTQEDKCLQGHQEGPRLDQAVEEESQAWLRTLDSVWKTPGKAIEHIAVDIVPSQDLVPVRFIPENKTVKIKIHTFLKSVVSSILKIILLTKILGGAMGLAL